MTALLAGLSCAFVALALVAINLVRSDGKPSGHVSSMTDLLVYGVALAVCAVIVSLYAGVGL